MTTKQQKAARARGPRGAGPGWLVVSVSAHAFLMSLVAVIAVRALEGKRAEEPPAPPPAPSVIAIELPGFDEGTLLSDHAEVPAGTAPQAFGGSTIARVDDGKRGRGGEADGERATNLADETDAMKLSPDLRSHLRRDQAQRLETARSRQTREDRRATTQPMELTFLASGSGAREERRAVSPRDPSRGSLRAARAASLGGAPGAREGEASIAPAPRGGAAEPGETTQSPGLGVRGGAPGEDHRASAAVAFGRPSVTEGPVAIPAVTRGRPRDTVDSDQEVATAVQSLVHASVAGALRAGAGRGGTEGGADPGAGGARGAGSVASPLGRGDGAVFDFDTRDPALMPYFRKLHAKIDPLWRDAFPKSAMLELKQGTVILEFVVEANGSAHVVWPPRRPSGVDEFDRNCADAIRRAAPFEPIPASLGVTRLRVRAPFVAKNPIVK